MLTLKVPRSGRTWLFLASIAGTAGLAAGSLFAAFPRWAPTGGLLIAGLAIALVVWRIWPHGTVKFDTRKGLVLKDGRPVARFGQIECVQITEPPIGKEKPWIVELCLAEGAPLFLGYTNDQIEAASLAARVAGAVDRPVRVGN